MDSFYKSQNKDFTLVQGDTLEILKQFDFKFDMIFADPPYFLSNDGITCKGGKMVSVNKGSWDKLELNKNSCIENKHEFNRKWIKLCRRILKPNGKVLCFGWNTNGVGKVRGFELTKILLVQESKTYSKL